MAGLRPGVVAVGYRIGAASLRALPRPLAERVARRGSEIWWRCSRARREVVARNLARASGLALGSGELDTLVRDAFVSYARYWVDATKIDLSDRGYFEGHWRLEHEEYVEEAYEAGKGVILALPHLGSWEIGGMYGLERGHPLTAVAEALEPPSLSEWFVAQRRAVGLRVVPLGAGATPALMRVLADGGILALVCDRDLTGEGIGVDFFGAPTRLPGGPALLALRSGAVLLPCAIYQGPHGVHEGVVCPPIDTTRHESLRADVTRVTSELARVLEDLISRAPAQWHVFQPNWPEDRDAEDH